MQSRGSCRRCQTAWALRYDCIVTYGTDYEMNTLYLKTHLITHKLPTDDMQY